jgi:hypothetical protein
MESPDDWYVAVKMEDGQYDTLSEHRGPAPSDIDTIYIPVSFPWSNSPEILQAYPEMVAGRERSSGQESHYSARTEGVSPNDVRWEVEVEIWEYPTKVFNTAQISITDTISYAHWDKSDLLDAVSD